MSWELSCRDIAKLWLNPIYIVHIIAHMFLQDVNHTFLDLLSNKTNVLCGLYDSLSNPYAGCRNIVKMEMLTIFLLLRYPVADRLIFLGTNAAYVAQTHSYYNTRPANPQSFWQQMIVLYIQSRGPNTWLWIPLLGRPILRIMHWVYFLF